MKKNYRLIQLVLFMVCLCTFVKGNTIYSAKPEDSKVDISDVTFMESETERDMALEKAFSKVLDLKPGENNVRYYYNRIDLNNDKEPETFVYLTGPFVCGTGGCSALIFQQIEGEYNLVSQFTLVRAPIIIRDRMTNGWNNIIMYVSGGGMEGRYKELIFNGNAYPSNPSVQPDVKDGKVKGIGIINDDMSKNNGIEF
ncbi:hypothetical protein JOC95_001785 [Bacillus tianshenii]|uniref:Lipoprotein n=1 Tax=Sutcliffiella tianshenii TaxID=1463404 RepID=A0ABS2NZZ9_9BACI|nr:hypothetical protein [Bacillus tianshenii]MBM7619933.1 hypothetical protein [Bacillus tianshenii]